MIVKNELTPEQINALIEKRVLGAAMVVLNVEVEKKLNYKYLGIRTNLLRSTTRAITSNGVLYFGTNPWYGAAYETGDFETYKNPSPDKTKFRSGVGYQRASWTGDPKKRPFLRDTIEDPKNLKRIAARARTMK